MIALLKDPVFIKHFRREWWFGAILVLNILLAYTVTDASPFWASMGWLSTLVVWFGMIFLECQRDLQQELLDKASAALKNDLDSFQDNQIALGMARAAVQQASGRIAALEKELALVRKQAD